MSNAVDAALLTASALMALAAAPPYIISTVRGKVKPERATWFIFSALGMIAFISQVSLGASTSLIFVGLDGLGSLSIFALSIKYGVGGWTKLDRIVLAIAGVGVILSFVSQQALIALFGVVIADLCGVVPTVLKAYKEPDSESQLAWLLFATGALLTVLTIHDLRFDLLLYPLYLAAANYAVPIAMKLGRLKPL